MAIDGGIETNWEAIREEYILGNMSQKTLAEKHGVSYGQLKRRAAAEGWAQARLSARQDGAEAHKKPEAVTRRCDGCVHNSAGETDAFGNEDGNTQIATRLRRKLLMQIERVADRIPDEAVTEIKSQDDGKVLMFKLRDLTAAYKDLANELLRSEDEDIEDLSPLEEMLK